MALIILFLVTVWGLAAATNSTQEAPMCRNGDAYPGLNTHLSFTKKPLDDIIFTEAVLSEEAARSKIDCGRKCVRAQGCVMYTFQPIQGVSSSRCRLYKQFHNLEDDKQTKPGARSYAMDMTGDPRSLGKGYTLVFGRCILVLNETMRYLDARQRCWELSQGHLLFTKNTEDISFGVRILDEYDIKRVWVGADDIEMEGHFVWADGTPLVNPSFLKRAKKYFDCVCLLRFAKRLNSCSCRKLKQCYVVCQRGA